MKPSKILYVDDEAMALKYFERLVSPITPVLTAASVEEGKAVLRQHAGEIAVLVSDQRMPGERGNELLRHARDFYPNIVRMLTTAYSELGEAIEAINSGEIYRYIGKPWELESLRADLKNALELADLRSERDGLMREKMLVQQQQLLAARLQALLLLASGFAQADAGASVYRLVQVAQAAGLSAPQIAWSHWDMAQLQQAEAQRGIAIVQGLAQWHRDWPPSATADDAAAAAASLAAAIGGTLESADAPHGWQVRLAHTGALTGLLTGAPGEPPPREAIGWLAWLLKRPLPLQLKPSGSEWLLCLSGAAAAPAIPANWLALAVEDLAYPVLV